MSVKLKLIAAASENMGIGINGTLPWRLKNEMAYFTKMTTYTKDSNKKNAVIMGRKSWDSIPVKFRPLSNRLNIVLTKSPEKFKLNDPDEVLAFDDLDKAIKHVEGNDLIESTWVIGGSHIYKAAIDHPNCHRIYLTEIQKIVDCDTFFPKFNDSFTLLDDHGNEADLVPIEKQHENGYEYYFRIYEKKM